MEEASSYGVLTPQLAESELGEEFSTIKAGVTTSSKSKRRTKSY